MTKTIDLTAPMIDELGVSLKGLDCRTTTMYGKFAGITPWCAAEILIDHGHMGHRLGRATKVTVPAHALVVKVLERLEARCKLEVSSAHPTKKVVSFKYTSNDTYMEYWECAMPTWFCSLFTKARKVAGEWVIND